MTKIIQVVAVSNGDSEPTFFGLGEDGGVYQWAIKTGSWSLFGVNTGRIDFHP